MKFVLVALLIPTTVFCQKRGDNEIIVEGISFSQVVKSLLDSGYIIGRIDSNYKTVATAFKHMHLTRNILTNGNMSIRVKVEDSTAYFTGTWLGDLDNMGIVPIGQSRGYLNIAFDAMNDFALSFGKPVKYIKVYPISF